MTAPRNKLTYQRGAALVIVLGFLIIITVLAMAFLSSVTSEVSSSRVQANTDRAQQLADSVPQIVISRIRDATSGREDANVATSKKASWASQPGMIRTYREDGTPLLFHRLYSGPSPTVSAASFQIANEVPPADWEKQKGVFTDLNRPIVQTSGSTGTKILQFPIIDPRAKASAAADSVPGFNYTSVVDGTVQPGAIADEQRIPMPVRWMYLLEDGSFATPDDSKTGVITFNGTVPSALNPIVGRIAFWTDDETCKVNINTAAEGTYYDIPRYAGPPDYLLSMYSPLVGEFQRYPGHPSTTSLSSVLKPWLPSPQDVPITYDLAFNPPGLSKPSPRYSSSTSTQIKTRLDRYLKLSPRYRFGGSEGGSVLTSVNPANTTITPLTPKTERLYSSIDELLYTPARTELDAGISASVLAKARFFLTANSRAPEVNLFGLPRISIWPLSTTGNSTYRTPQDTLIARCGTIGDLSPSSTSAKPFYFQRSNPKSPVLDYDGIPRNQELYTYLQGLADRDIPGFGDSFNSKYGVSECSQILTEVFDYIRSCNLNDPNLPTNGTYTDSYQLGGTYQNPFSSPYRSPGLVVPIKIGTTKGSGRYPVIDQAFLVFYTPEIPANPLPAGGAVNTETKIRAALFFNFMNPMQGFMVSFTNIQLEVEALGSFAIEAVSNADPLKSASLPSSSASNFGFFKEGAKVTQWANANERGSGQGSPRNYGGNHSYSALAAHTISSTDPRKAFYLVSKNIPIVKGDPAHAKWTMRGGTFKARLLTAAGDEIQTYEFEFPDSANLPLPTPWAKPLNTSPVTYSRQANDIEVGGVAQVNGIPLIHDKDTNPADPTKQVSGGPIVRSLQLADKPAGGGYLGGDFRRLSVTRTVPKTWFAKHKDYDSGNRFAHSLRDGHGLILAGATTSGNLITGHSFMEKNGPSEWVDSSHFPYVRQEINGVYASSTGANSDAPADWNNGFGNSPDGAYLNRADEGVAFSASGGGEPYFEWDGVPQNKNLTSPNKQLPSAGMFGSLPTGTTSGISWQTLLFRPDYSGKHPGARSPADSLLLDWFWMPVVEPYAISEPFSTAGKVNMNYQILPFTYITRDTGIRAVMAAERILAIPGSQGSKNYAKSAYNRLNNPDYRFKINATETLKGFQQRFANGEIFRSASEICSLDLVPEDTGAQQGSMANYWNTHQGSGDNVKERPYTTIYPRLTTKSNTYTVHFLVQALKKRSGTPQESWYEGSDLVSSEYRGSAMIERYIDPSDPLLPDFATKPDETAEDYYRWRVTNIKRFSP